MPSAEPAARAISAIDVVGLDALDGEDAEGVRQEGVAGEDRHRLAEDRVARRAPAPEVVVVHRRQVVVHERVGVDHLERARDRQHVGLGGVEELAGRDAERRPQALAAREEAVAHRAVQVARRRVLGRDEPVEPRDRSIRLKSQVRVEVHRSATVARRRRERQCPDPSRAR
jgi:hypothetical protein